MTENIGYCDIQYRRGSFQLNAALQVPARGITGIYGASGAGKTSLLRCIAGLEREVQGKVELGQDCWQCSAEKIFVPPYKRRLAYVFQDARLFPHLSVLANLNYSQRRNSGKGSGLELGAVIEQFGLQKLLVRRPTELSGGEQQRVAVARALLRNPQLVLMDEPLASLDHASKQQILPFFEELHTQWELPVFYVSHSMQEIVRLCDNLVIIEAGNIVAQGDLQSVTARLDLPVLSGPQAGSVLSGTVTGYDESDNISEISLSGCRLFAVGKFGEHGSRVRFRVMASDVSLSLERPSSSSILNTLPVRIDDFHLNKAEGYVSVRLKCCDDFLLAQVTRRSWEQMGLAVQQSLYAQVKTLAFKRDD